MGESENIQVQSEEATMKVGRLKSTPTQVFLSEEEKAAKQNLLDDVKAKAAVHAKEVQEEQKKKILEEVKAKALKEKKVEMFDKDGNKIDSPGYYDSAGNWVPLIQRPKVPIRSDQADELIDKLIKEKYADPNDPKALLEKSIKLQVAAAAQENVIKFIQNRPEIEKKRAEQIIVAKQQSKEVIAKHVISRIAKQGKEAQVAMAKHVRIRDLLGDLNVRKDYDFKTLYRDANLHIVMYPPQHRVIQTGRDHGRTGGKNYRFPFPYVVFAHVFYDRNNHYQHRNRNVGTRDVHLNHHLFVGFTGEEIKDLGRVNLYSPPLPHVENFGICLGPIQSQRNGNLVTTEDMLDAFWNNRFIYGERELRYNTWANMTQQQALEHDWSKYGHGTCRLDRFPPNLKQFRDYFE